MADTLDIPAILAALKQEQVIEFFTQMRTDLTAAQQTILQLRADVNTKALATTVSTLSQRVTTAEGTLNQKADTAAVNQQIQTITTLDASQSQAITTLQQAFANEDGTVQGLAAIVTGHTTQLAGLRTDVNDKAPSATVANLSGRVTTLNNDLATVKGTADANAAAIGNTTTGLAAAHDGLSKRLRKDVADSTAFSLGVPKAAGMDRAVQKSELVGGLQQPYRFFLDVQATPVAAFQRSGERIDIADDNGTGQVLVLTKAEITNTGGAAIAGSITITAKSAAGTVVFTQSIPVALTSVPAVGKTLDLLSLLSTPPADIPLTEPIFFFVSATTGKYTVRLEGKKR